MILRAFVLLLAFYGVALGAENAPQVRAPELADRPGVTDCDRLAGHPSTLGHGAGVAFDKIDPQAAIPACEAAIRQDPNAARLVLNLGRAKLAVKDYPAALELHQRAADMGNTLAMGLLGNMYEDGLGVPKDDNKASEWYRKAAELGNAEAMGALASTYLFGRGNPQDYKIAATWFQKGADLGDARSMADLGDLYFEGKGIPQDFSLALYWSRRGAEGGNTKAMENLGAWYLGEKGVQRDLNQTLMWWNKAVDLGDADAMARLGWLYRLGKDVPADYSKAMELFQRAVALGNAGAMQGISAMYFNGESVPKDAAQALAWDQKAVAHGGDPAPIALMLGLTSDFKGITKDPDAAADAAIKSLKMQNNLLVKPLTERWLTWTGDFRQAFQRRLKDEGLFSGQTDGYWSPEIEIAVKKLVDGDHPSSAITPIK